MLSKCGIDFTIAFLSWRQSKKIKGTSNSEFGWRSYAPRKMLRCRDFRPKSELPMVGTSDGRDFWLSGFFTRVRTSDPRRNFQLSGLPTQVGISSRPNKKACSDLVFWIPIRTVPNSWKNWKIRLREVSYWDKTTPSIYMRESWPIEFPPIQSSKHNKPVYSYPFTLFSNLPAIHPLIHDQGWHSRLAGQPRATRRRPCPDGVSPGRELWWFLCSFAWKLVGSSSCKYVDYPLVVCL
jgi:hypothetical protein